MSPQDGQKPDPSAAAQNRRLDELLARVKALEERVDALSPPPHSAAAEPFLERLANYKRDARAERIAQSSSQPANPAFDTGEFEAIFDQPQPPQALTPPTAPPTAPPLAPPTAPPMPVIYSSSAAAYPPPAQPVAPPRVPELAPPLAPPTAAVPPLAPSTPRPLPARPVAPPPPPPKPKPAMTLESLIGMKFFMAAGSIIVVIGVVLGLKWGIDQGWFKFPPAFRCIAAATFGAALLCAGEFARRRINAFASAGLFSAGVAIMYGSAWAAYGFFKPPLVSAPTGFVLLALAAAIGIIAALRANLVSVAILSLAGAYVAPLLARAQHPSPLVLPAYLFALLVLGLVLSAWRPRPFRALRAVVWWATVFFGTSAVIYAARQDQHLIGISFLALVWAAIHAELWFGARKAPETTGPVAPKGLTWAQTRPVLSTFATSIWVATLGVWCLRWGTTPPFPQDWMLTGALAVATAVLSFVLAGNLRVLIDTPETDSERIGVALLAQTGALVVATLVLGLVGRAEVIAGVALGVSTLFAARWIKSRPMDVYGLIVLALTVGRMVVYDSWRGMIQGPAVAGKVLVGLNITEWSLLMCTAAAGWAAAGVLLIRSQREGGFWRGLGVAAIGVALSTAFAAFLSPHSDPASLITLAMLTALAALGIARMLRSRGLDIYAICVLGITTAELILLETQPFRALSPTKPGTIILGLSLTRWTGLMLAAAAAWTLIGGVLRRSDRSPEGAWNRAGVACIGFALCVAFAAFISPNAASIALLILGILMCVACFGVAHALKSQALTVVAFAALAIASSIALFAQLFHVEQLSWSWRASGLILSRWGMAMLLAALVWTALAFTLRRSRDLCVACVIGAVVMFFASAFARGADHGPVAWVWLAMSAGVFLAHFFFARLYLDVMAYIGLLAATGLWATTYAFGGWSTSTAPIALHPGLLQGLALAAAFAVSAFLVERRCPTAPEFLRYAFAVAIALVFLSTSFEVRRAASELIVDQTARKACLSIWWGIFGLALIVGGFWRRVPLVRHAGLGLMVIATAKALIFDLADVSEGWRVASFLGLGLMLLAVAIGYAKAHKTLENAGKPEPEPGP